jgi:hypothetical protein
MFFTPLRRKSQGPAELKTVLHLTSRENSINESGQLELAIAHAEFGIVLDLVFCETNSTNAVRFPSFPTATRKAALEAVEQVPQHRVCGVVVSNARPHLELPGKQMLDSRRVEILFLL